MLLDNLIGQIKFLSPDSEGDGLRAKHTEISKQILGERGRCVWVCACVCECVCVCVGVCDEKERESAIKVFTDERPNRVLWSSRESKEN